MTDLAERTEQEERAERKRLESIWWGGVLVWVGLTLGAEYLDILPRIGDTSEWWPWIFIGVGPWSLILNGYRASSSTAPNPSAWDWIWTVIFMLIALGTVVELGWEIVGAAVLVVVGLGILLRATSRG